MLRLVSIRDLIRKALWLHKCNHSSTFAIIRVQKRLNGCIFVTIVPILTLKSSILGGPKKALK
jgi:hypothetical protein